MWLREWRPSSRTQAASREISQGIYEKQLATQPRFINSKSLLYRMGSRPNLNIQKQFRKLPNHSKYKVILRKFMHWELFWLICFLQDQAVSRRHCNKTLAYGASRQQQHLDHCQRYLSSLQETKKRKLDDESPLLATFDRISPHEHSRLDELAALMIYDAGLPLSFFEHPAVKAFLHRLRPAYNLPSRARLSTTLLKDSYQSVRQEVKEYLDK
jgi:hypothetical protein